MKSLKISQVLVYYDMPQLFVATDSIGTSYLCLLTDLNVSSPSYIANPISKARLAAFLNGNIDLLAIFKYPELNEWYSLEITESDIKAEPLDIQEFPKQFLPDSDFYVNKVHGNDEIILNEVLENDNVVVHLGVGDNKIGLGADAGDVGDILKIYTLLVEYSLRKVVKERKLKKVISIVPRNYELRAIGASRASFNIHLVSDSQKDLFGNCALELGLDKITEVLSFNNREDLLLLLKSLKGHAGSSLKKLVKKIMEDDLKVKHKWFAPNKNSVQFQIIDKAKATVIYDTLNSSEELTEEIREFKGIFVQADVTSGTWRFKAADEKKELNGEANPDDLKGITLETVRYKIVTQEIIEELKVTEREKHKYILKSVEHYEAPLKGDFDVKEDI